MMYYVHVDVHQQMLNVTSRLAVKVKYLPDGIVDWSDTSPQRSRSTLTINDLVPNEADGEEMYIRAVKYMMRFMATHFRAFSQFKVQVPPLTSPHPVTKSQVAQLKILDKDEKYTNINIDILECFKSDAQFSCNPQVHVYVYFINTNININFIKSG